MCTMHSTIMMFGDTMGDIGYIIGYGIIFMLMLIGLVIDFIVEKKWRK